MNSQMKSYISAGVGERGTELIFILILSLPSTFTCSTASTLPHPSFWVSMEASLHRHDCLVIALSLQPFSLPQRGCSNTLITSLLPLEPGPHLSVGVPSVS